MSLFSPKSSSLSGQNNRIWGYRVQRLDYGAVIPILIGRNRVAGTVIWTGDFQAIPVKEGSGKGFLGKGSSGGKGGSGAQQYTYKTALVIGLAQGVVNNVLGVWRDRTRYYVGRSTETFTLGGSHQVSQHANFLYDAGVARHDSYSVMASDYGSPGAVSLSGTQLTPLLLVGSAPGAGQYTVNVSTGTYGFSGADAGKTVEISYSWAVPSTSTNGQPLTALNFSFFKGDAGQSVWPFLTTNHPDQALGYTQLSYAASDAFDLGSSGVISNMGWELVGPLSVGGGIDDANPADCLSYLLTDSAVGVRGFLGSDLPAPGSIVGLDASGEVWKYCAANGLFVSPLLDQQQTAATWLQDILTVANANAFSSEGVLKFRSYGDTTAVGNGATYTPDTQPQYDLNDDDFICAEGESPVIVSRKTVRDAYNRVTVEWTNRYNDYNFEPVYEQDDWSVDKYGLRAQSTVTMHSICDQRVAQKVSNTLLKRLVYVRAQVKFKLPAYYFLLEPMDLVTIPKSYIYNAGGAAPVRITSIEEQEKGELAIEAEEFPWSVSAPTAHPKQGAASFGPGFFADPGDVNGPVFVEIPPDVAQGSLYTIGIALSGGPNWGGVNVFISTDGGASYSAVGGHAGAATMGVLTAQLIPAPDPDNAHTLSVDLTESFGELPSYTQDQEDALVSLIAIDRELLSYRTATLTASNRYDLTHLRRGAYGTVVGQHNVGAGFVVVDGGLFDWQYEASAIGTTVMFKFASFNLYGQMAQDLSKISAYPYFVRGPREPFIWSPGYAQPVVGDGLETADGFGVQPAYHLLEGGDVAASVIIKGVPPISQISGLIGPPTIIVNVLTGGSVPAGNYAIGAVAYDAATSGRNYGTSLLSEVVSLTAVPANSQITVTGVHSTAGRSLLAANVNNSTTAIPVEDGTLYLAGETIFIDAEQLGPISAITGNTLTAPRGINGTTAAAHTANAVVYTVAWPTAYGGDVYIAALPDPAEDPGTLLATAWHYERHVTAGQSWAVVTAIVGQSTGAPDPLFDHFAVVPQRVERPGCWTDFIAVGGVTPTTIKIDGAFWSTDQWADRFAVLLAHADSSLEIEIACLPITSNTADTLTIGANLAGAGPTDLTTFLKDGDLITVTIQPTTVTANGFSDANFVNSFSPAGLDASAERGRLAVVLYGTGAGQVKKIGDNGSGAGPITLSSNWDTLPDPTSVIVIISAQQFDAYRTQPAPTPNKTTFSGEVARIDTLNFSDAVWMLRVFTEDVNNSRGPEASRRMIGVLGAQGTRTITSDDVMQVTDGVVLFDTNGLTGTTTTLSAAIPDAVTTIIHLINGAATVFNTDLLIGTERMRVKDNAGTNTPTVERGVANTTPAAHSNGAAVSIPAILTFVLQRAIDVPNVKLIASKTSSDINAVDVKAGGTMPNQDTFPDGSTDFILPDNSPTDGTTSIVFPGA